jgi:hypothetical protein
MCMCIMHYIKRKKCSFISEREKQKIANRAHTYPELEAIHGVELNCIPRKFVKHS